MQADNVVEVRLPSLASQRQPFQLSSLDSANGVLYNLLTLPTGKLASTSPVNEPAVAYGINGRILVTCNWGAAFSLDYGATWTTLNPYTLLTSFCCDQDVVYDPANDIFYHILQGSSTLQLFNGRERILETLYVNSFYEMDCLFQVGKVY